MDKKRVITSFVYNRPESVAAYGYGSGVFKQEGYKDSDKPQIDVFFLVDDLKEWHQKNMKMNSSDYSLMGRVYVNMSSIERLKGHNNITYYSHIYENGYRFKYGVMEEQDFLSSLKSWDNFFIAGRFHKPVLEIKGNSRLESAINENKRQAVLVSAILAPRIIRRKDFYHIICSLSYCGTLRMYVAENPHKIDNIVNGNFDRLQSLYEFDEDYIKVLDERYLKIDHDLILRHVKELPVGLLTYMYENNYDVTSLMDLRKAITLYLAEHNKKEEIYQTIDSIKTNGVVRSTPYLLAKVSKRITGK